MWICDIKHSTTYEYENEVRLHPHTLKLYPKLQRGRRLTKYATEIRPAPAGLWTGTDQFGNAMEQVWFMGHLSTLTIESTCQLELDSYDPFHFLVYPMESMELSYYKLARIPAALRLYTNNEHSNEIEQDVLNTCASKGKGEIIPFLMELNRYIYTQFRPERREIGPAKAARRTFADGKGTCRDLTILFMHFCRLMHLPARFTSGYYIEEQGNTELHAWAEVYIFGAGWIGFDPSKGIICTWRFIPLASGVDQLDTMPVSGSFFGAGNVQLRTELNVVFRP